MENLKREHPSKPRNKLIAMIFYYANLIEKWGTGTLRILELCKKYGLPEPNFKEEFNGFTVTLWKDKITEEFLKKLELNERQIKAVLFVKRSGKITNKKYQKLTGVKKRQATEDLIDLCNKKIFERKGKTGRNVFYVLNENFDNGVNGA